MNDYLSHKEKEKKKRLQGMVKEGRKEGRRWKVRMRVWKEGKGQLVCLGPSKYMCVLVNWWVNFESQFSLLLCCDLLLGQSSRGYTHTYTLQKVVVLLVLVAFRLESIWTPIYGNFVLCGQWIINFIT